jgi:hypothetical protein
LRTYLPDNSESVRVAVGRLALALELFYVAVIQRFGIVLLQNIVWGGRMTCKESGFILGRNGMHTVLSWIAISD